ncbi:MAG TPA: acyl-CoA dehydrogenase family protein [Candidatus Thermoplasmatota archaeon]|nr:acyl-CoA dehydrogenase family protein [Candidatus Thermoplasmatota archaeon]
MALEFTFSEEQELFRATVREFLDSEIRPMLPRGFYEGHEFPWDIVRKLQRQGFMGVPIPRELGGAGLGEVGYCILLEELAKVSGSIATIVGAHTGICVQPLYLFGTPDQRERFVRPLSEGKAIGAFALTEPEAGSDAANIKTIAEKDGDDYLLTGTKIYVTNGNVADYLMVSAVTDPALGARGGVTTFIVESKSEGFKVANLEDKMGIRLSTTAEIRLDGVRVPKENILGNVGEGFIAALTALDGGRVALGVGNLGGAVEILDRTIRYAKAREQFGEPIGKKQATQFTLAELAAEIYAARVAAYLTTQEVEHYYELVAAGKSVPRQFRARVSRQTAMIKILGSEIAGKAIDRCLQIYGARGFMEGFDDLEEGFRDHIINEIFEGTNEIQRLIIGRELYALGGFEL